MSDRTIKPEEFEKAVMQALAKYGDDAQDILETVTKDVSRSVVKVLKASPPAGGPYAAGWTHKFKRGGAFTLLDVVYNRKYQLPHLLEKSHETGGDGVPKGKYPSHVDYTGTIAAVEEKYGEWYMEEVLRRL